MLGHGSSIMQAMLVGEILGISLMIDSPCLSIEVGLHLRAIDTLSKLWLVILLEHFLIEKVRVLTLISRLLSKASLLITNYHLILVNPLLRVSTIGLNLRGIGDRGINQ